MCGRDACLLMVRRGPLYKMVTVFEAHTDANNVPCLAGGFAPPPMQLQPFEREVSRELR